MKRKTALCIFLAAASFSGGAEDRLSFVKPAETGSAGKKEKEYLISCIGNSITRHGFNAQTIRNLGWGRECGMAASCEANDYAHLLAGRIQKLFPERKVRLVFNRADPESDLIVWQGGEHDVLPEKLATFERRLTERLREYLRITPHVIVIGIWNPVCREEFKECTASFYPSAAKQVEAIEKKVCRDLGIPFAAVSEYENDPENTGSGEVAGVRWHPNDNGMKRYAEAAYRACLETMRRK